MFTSIPLIALLASAVTAIPHVRDSTDSCTSLRLGSCNANTIDKSNIWNNTACVLYAVCSYPIEKPSSVPIQFGASTNQPRLSEDTFKIISGGKDTLTQQAYIDAYYGAISNTPNGTYPDSSAIVIQEFANIAAWTGDCSSLEIPYSNFADWLEYASQPGVCPAVSNCDPSKAVGPSEQCVPQPSTDNGSCSQMKYQCELWVTGGLFQNLYCVLASMCYAESTTDILIAQEYPTWYPNIPTSASEARLSYDVFTNMTKGASTMSEQNAIDAYYGALTGIWISAGGPFGAESPEKTSQNGPYPTSSSYVSNFWSIIAAWTGYCDSKEIPYSNLADYFNYAATSNYHPTC
ncbi:hypothetical protein PLICRDRAFT_158144 [Plicaturopsis crispa FD-325 SS-3]|nr:hypothetical protein PLICRDRAFT_158144 [Plicaturopsis crispa FD-325 SS-3]